MNRIDRLLSDQRPSHRAGNSRSPLFLAVRLQAALRGSVRSLKRLLEAVRVNPKERRLKITVCVGAAVAVVAMTALVGFAITAPAIPPGLIAVLPSPPHFLTNDGKGRAGADPGASSEEGAGSNLLDRVSDMDYMIRPGETLSEIANSYGLNYRMLGLYNNVKDAHLVIAGMKIVIPSKKNEEALSKTFAARDRPSLAKNASQAFAKLVRFTAEKLMDGKAVSVHFKVVEPPVDKLQDFEWNLGDGQRSFRPEPSYDYIEPRTYTVMLSAHDKSGALYRSKPYYIDIPQPQTSAEGLQSRFYTLSSLREQLKIEGQLVKVRGYDSIEQAPVSVVEQDESFTTLNFSASGYYGLTLSANEGQRYASVFVSPVPTIHSDREDINWYKTQYNTGTQSNCGPASAAMAIDWATSASTAVISVRQAIGWKGDGSVSLEELLGVLKKRDVDASLKSLYSAQDMRDVIDRGGIAIILIHTGSLAATETRPDRNLYGKYYNDAVGHYIVIKGYTLDGQNFVSYDPIPSDWSGNSMRYADQVSMIGRNRYYPVPSIMQGLRRNDMIAVFRSSDS